jgi:hypothetical protein
MWGGKNFRNTVTEAGNFSTGRIASCQWRLAPWLNISKVAENALEKYVPLQSCSKLSVCLLAMSYIYLPICRFVLNFCNGKPLLVLTERRGRVVNTPSYSGGLGFRSLPRDRLFWMRVFVFSSVTIGKCRNSNFIPDDGGSTHLWNVGRQLFYTAVHPRRQFWTSYSPLWEL